jgi:hypothetical protein
MPPAAPAIAAPPASSGTLTLPTTLEAFPVALPTTEVALSAAPLTAATGAGLRLDFELLLFRLLALGLLLFRLLDFELLLLRLLVREGVVFLLDEPRERAGDFFEPPERLAEGFALV